MRGHLNLVDAGAGPLRLEPSREAGRAADSRQAAAGRPQPAAALPSPESRELYSLILGAAEHAALIRALLVVKDNWWLDPISRSACSSG